MRYTAIVSIGLTALLAALIVYAANSSDAKAAAAKSEAAASKRPPVQSGVYGYSGGRVPYGDPEGVVGECIWIFDEHNKTQVAKGDCAERSPGKFRVVLKPGRYVVHGPGGNTPIEVKPGKWVKIESVVSLPLAP
ncbi:MAG TPA: hypothetical protein VJN94_09860 [Candidatus Binataceae bacterium]|nr:hypothetical protein [Candidatus Binataceae bacterium]